MATIRQIVRRALDFPAQLETAKRQEDTIAEKLRAIFARSITLGRGIRVKCKYLSTTGKAGVRYGTIDGRNPACVLSPNVDTNAQFVTLITPNFAKGFMNLILANIESLEEA